MKYYKNIELANMHNVSEKAVRNWVQGAAEGKIDLQLIKENGRVYIANTSKNMAAITELVERGKKFRNTRGFKTVSPTAEFYNFFQPNEVFDIISSLDTYRELPNRYSYFNGGAADWDRYIQKLSQETGTNVLFDTLELLNSNQAYIDNLLSGYDRINVVDIGPGNCYPVRGLLEHLYGTGKLGRYIGIDISQAMLDIAERNIIRWFDGNVHFEGYTRDINYERFVDLLEEDALSKETRTINLIVFLGSTIANFRRPTQALNMVHDSIGKDDLVLFSRSLDTEKVRRYFDYNPDSAGHVVTGKPRQRYRSLFLLDLLAIDDSLYELEQFFDSDQRARRVQVRLKVALEVEFQLRGKIKTIYFNKGESILIWQHKHQNRLEIIDQFDQSDFEVLQMATSKDQEYLMLISKLKTRNDTLSNPNA